MRSVSWLSAVVVLAVSSSASAFRSPPGAIFHSELSGFQINPPPGWVRIPGKVLGTSSALRVSKDRPGVEVGFHPASGGSKLAYPYVIVTVIPYVAFGLDRQVTEEEMREIALEIGDRKPTPGSAAVAEPGIPEAGSPRPVFDAAQHSAVMSYEVDVPRVGRVHSRSACFFGREAMVQVTFSTKSDSLAAHAAACDQLLESFRFDPDQMFVKSLGAGIIEEDELKFAGTAPQAAALGGVALGLVLYAVSRHRRRMDQPDAVDGELQPAWDGQES